jgi:streptogramin lyase
MQVKVGKLWRAASLLGLAATAAAATWSNVAIHPVPTSQSNPVRTAAGPDGAIWFTELFGNRIGRITTAGAITEFPVPTPDSGLYGMMTGPDGHSDRRQPTLWDHDGAGRCAVVYRISG